VSRRHWANSLVQSGAAVPYSPALAERFGDRQALALQQLFYNGGYGWTTVSTRELGAQLGWTHTKAGSAFQKLEAVGVVERAPETAAGIPRRICRDALAAAIPRAELHTGEIENERNLNSNRSSTGVSKRSSFSGPPAGSKPVQFARAPKEGEREVEEDEDTASSSFHSDSAAAGGQETNPEHEQHASGCCVCEGPPTWIADNPVRCQRCRLPVDETSPAGSETPDPQDKPGDNGSDEVEVADAVDAVRGTFGRIR
jgi:hypothetical protein